MTQEHMVGAVRGVGYPRAEDSGVVPWLGGRWELFPRALNHSVTL